MLSAHPVSATGAAVPGVAVVYTTLDSTVAVVSPAGVVRARARGMVTIQATAATGRRDEFVAGAVTLTVTSVVRRVALGAAAIVVPTGDSTRLTASARTAGGAAVPDATIRWVSRDTAVARVDDRGVVAARRGGTVVVVAAAEGPEDVVPEPVADSLVLIVRPRVARVVVLAPDTVTAGDTVTLRAEAYDASGTPMPRVTFGWSSSDTTVASTTAEGGLIARSLGAVAITVIPMDPADPAAPVRTGATRVEVRLAFTQIAAGTLYTCAVARGGVAHCWGFTRYGRLGVGPVAREDGEVVARPTPVRSDARFVSLGGDKIQDGHNSHVCGVDTGGAVYCWGSAEYGMLGDGRLGEGGPTTAFSDIPLRVPGLPPATRVALGGTHTCALLVDGSTRCAGDNSLGMLGASAITVPCDGARRACSPRFSPVADVPPFRELVAGIGHTCGLTSVGEAWCWGLASEVGTGSLAYVVRPAAPVLGGLRFRTLAAGASHTCGVTAEGTAYCWGSNYAGEVGTGATPSPATWAPQPALVRTPARFARIVAGQHHTCALTDAGVAYCWGENTSGQVGVPASGPVVSPQPVQTALRFVTLAAGEDHTCGLTADGTAYCWGGNSVGQLGAGAAGAAAGPTKVSGQR